MCWPPNPEGSAPPRVALTLAGPGAARAGFGAGAPSSGAGAASPEQDRQRGTALRTADEGVGVCGRGKGGAPATPVSLPGPAPQPPHSPWPGGAPGKVAAPVEGGGAVRAPQCVRAVPAHAAPRGRRALEGSSAVTAAGRGAHPGPWELRDTRRLWTAALRDLAPPWWARTPFRAGQGDPRTAPPRRGGRVWVMGHPPYCGAWWGGVSGSGTESHWCWNPSASLLPLPQLFTALRPCSGRPWAALSTASLAALGKGLPQP